MATDARVKELFEKELKDRAPGQLRNAGKNWHKNAMDFFFPQNEFTVDLCALAVLDKALEEDQTTITKKARKNVASLISTKTLAGNAIKIVSLTTLKPTPI